MFVERRKVLSYGIGALGVAVALVTGAACSRRSEGPGTGDAPHVETESWAVTAWGDRYEVFPEVDPLVAGEAAEAHTHVTVLEDFSPLEEGRVAIVLRDAAGGEQSFGSTRARRPGIFGIELRPAREGEYELLFRIDSQAGSEEIAGGRVRVGTATAPGGALAVDGVQAEEVSFLKEQQWRTPFATAWAQVTSLRAGVTAPARVVPRPGGDRVLTAPAAGRLESEPWPHAGLAIRRGGAVFRLVPRLDEDISLAEREAAVAALEAELSPAAARAGRLDRLAAEGVVAREQAELAAGERDALSARLAGARRDLETARRSRAGVAGPGESLVVAAPFDGVVAEVEATPGEAVEAGAVIAHFVAAGGWWLEASLPPRAAAELTPGPVDASLRIPGGETIALAPGATRLAALAPEISAASGRVSALLQLPEELVALRAGEAVELELAAGPERRGVVLPASALVDDAGVTIAYVQSSGEGFERREVAILARHAERVLLEGIRPGERVVVTGANAIRRSTLAGTGLGEGHVH
jgi:RND family efflux transporter MFP subunit